MLLCQRGDLRLKTATLAVLCSLAAAPTLGAAPRCGSREEKAEWKLTLMGFAQLLPLSIREVDGALEGRFFPKTTTFALTTLEGGKHFIRLRCRDISDKECGKDRDEVEFRAVAVTLLRVIGKTPDQDSLYDPRTWELRPLGQRKIEELKKCHPDLWERLSAVVLAGLSPKKR